MSEEFAYHCLECDTVMEEREDDFIFFCPNENCSLFNQSLIFEELFDEEYEDDEEEDEEDEELD